MARGLMSWLETAVAEEGKAEACPAAYPTGPLVLRVSGTWWPSSFGLMHIRLDSEQILNGAESWLDSCRWSARGIVRNEERSPRDKVSQLLEFITEAGLPIPEQPRPRTPVRRDDVRIVCWMAVTPCSIGAAETGDAEPT